MTALTVAHGSTIKLQMIQHGSADYKKLSVVLEADQSCGSTTL